MKGTTFDNYDSFIDYMEQHHNFNNGTEAVEIPVPSEEIETGTYYDEYGNEISEEALTRRLEDKNDNVVCELLTATKMWFLFDIRPRMEPFSPSRYARG